MAGLLGVIAVTGRWPVDAPRTHVEAGGILSLPAARVARVEFSPGEQRAVFSRNSREGWLFNDVPIEPAVASHIDTAVRLLTISAPRRVLAAGEYSLGQLAEYGLASATLRPCRCRGRRQHHALGLRRGHPGAERAVRPYR